MPIPDTFAQDLGNIEVAFDRFLSITNTPVTDQTILPQGCELIGIRWRCDQQHREQHGTVFPHHRPIRRVVDPSYRDSLRIHQGRCPFGVEWTHKDERADDGSSLPPDTQSPLDA